MLSECGVSYGECEIRKQAVLLKKLQFNSATNGTFYSALGHGCLGHSNLRSGMVVMIGQRLLAVNNSLAITATPTVSKEVRVR